MKLFAELLFADLAHVRRYQHHIALFESVRKQAKNNAKNINTLSLYSDWTEAGGGGIISLLRVLFRTKYVSREKEPCDFPLYRVAPR